MWYIPGLAKGARGSICDTALDQPGWLPHAVPIPGWLKQALGPRASAMCAGSIWGIG